jgi:hypothetical protein
VTLPHCTVSGINIYVYTNNVIFLVILYALDLRSESSDKFYQTETYYNECV